MERWQIILLALAAVLYALIASFIAFGLFTPTPPGSPPSPYRKFVRRDFGCCLLAILASIAWPVPVVLTAATALIDKFLCTPGYTCCGCSCAKYFPPQRRPTPAMPRSDEHNLEAGLNPAPPTIRPTEVISVPPPVHEAMGSGTTVPLEPPPPYK